MSRLLIQSIEVFCECTSSLLPQDSRIFANGCYVSQHWGGRNVKNVPGVQRTSLLPDFSPTRSPGGTRRSQNPGIEVGKRKLFMTVLNPETHTWPTTKGIFPKLSR